jgi:hypothetical protein
MKTKGTGKKVKLTLDLIKQHTIQAYGAVEGSMLPTVLLMNIH